MSRFDAVSRSVTATLFIMLGGSALAQDTNTGVDKPAQAASPAPQSTQLPALEVTAKQQKSATKKVKATKQPTSAPAPQPIATPPGTVVDDTTMGTTKTFGNPPPPYAGGQVARGGSVGFLGSRDYMDTPFNQTNFTSKTIEDQQSQQINDVLANTPSVRSVQTRSGANDQIEIRGFSVNSLDFAYDGLFGMNGQRRIGLESIERVEVLKGPSALINGFPPGASVGGTINLVPKYALDNPLTSVTLGFSSDGQFREHLDYSRRFGEGDAAGLRINLANRNGDSPVDLHEEDFISGTVAADYRGDGFRLKALFGHEDYRANAPQFSPQLGAGVPVPSAPSNTTNLSQPWGYVDAVRTYGLVGAEFDLAPNWTASIKYGRHHFDEEFLRTSVEITGANGDYNTGSAQFLPNVRDDQTIDAALRGEFDTGPVKHFLVLGATGLWGDQSIIFQGGLSPGIDTNYYNQAYEPYPDLSGVRTSGPRTALRIFKGAAIADTLSILDERVQFTVGARYQQISTKGFSNVTGELTSAYESDAVSPMYGLVVKPFSFMSLYGNYIQGLESGGVAPDDDPAVLNPGEILPPAETEQKEVGVKLDFGRIGGTISAFDISRPYAVLNTDTGIFGLNGETRVRGIEVETFGEVYSGLRVLGGVAFLDPELVSTDGGANDGNQVSGVSDFLLSMGLEWDTPFIRGLTLTGRAVHNSSAFVEDENLRTVPSWTTFDLGARYSFEMQGTPVVLRANVLNAFDSDFWIARGGESLMSGNPRTFLVSTQFNF